MYRNYFIALVFSALLAGCKKDFLELTPPSTITDGNFYKTAADFNLAALSVYDALQPRFYQESNWTMMEMVTDNTYTNATAGAFGEPWYQIDEFRTLTDNNLVTNQWRFSYTAINRANLLLEKSNEAQLDAAAKAPFEGEAQFIRAYLYFNLVRLYGDVPLVTTTLSPQESFKITRAPASEIYRLIETDLLAAEQKLPETYTGANIGRATKGAARALLGKVYLTQKKYAEAVTVLRQVVASNRYSLLPNFADVFRANNANHAESIFEIQYKSGQGTEGSPFVDAMAPSTFRINQLYGAGANSTGQGNGVVTADLFNAFSATDKRRDISIGSIGAGATQVYFQKKYATPTAAFLDAEDNFPVLRYADVLLMLAEALNEQSYGSADAFKAINDIRFRAGLNNLDATTTPNQQAFRDALLQERRLELAFENHRWFDLLRAGTAVQTLKAKGYPIQDFHVLFPIPQRDRNLTGLPQNPGY